MGRKSFTVARDLEVPQMTSFSLYGGACGKTGIFVSVTKYLV